MQMDQKTEEALRKSIEHWERLKGISLGKEGPYASDCPLCAIFNPPDGTCYGSTCPVAREKGHCQHSPWGSANEAWSELEGALRKWKQAVRDEIGFLKSLLPRKKRAKGKKL